MQPPFRISLAVALFALVASPVLAQPPESGFLVNPPNRVNRAERGMYVLGMFPAQIDFIDVAARIVTLREFNFKFDGFKLDFDQKPLPAEPIKVSLAADAKIVRLESALPASELRIGDVVTVLGQRMPTAPRPRSFAFATASNQQLPTPNLLRIAERNFRSASRAKNFEVVALTPQLILQLGQGGVPLDPNRQAGLTNTPFSNGDGKVIGSLSLAKAENGAGTVTILRLTQTTKLEFDRTTPVELYEIAAQHAAGKISIKVEFSDFAARKREITRLVVSNLQ